MRFQPGDTVRMFGDEGIVLEVRPSKTRRDRYLVDFGSVLGELSVSEADLESIPHLSPRKPVLLESPELRARALKAWLRDQDSDE